MGTSEPHLLRVLINSAEKASNIARLCRSNDELLSLLVEEKTGPEANARFEHDFKTLADVTIQETIKWDIETLFPVMQTTIRGEESPHFSNVLGETVAIHVDGSQQNTANILGAVLHGNRDAAEVLAAEVHRKVEYDGDEAVQLPELPADLDYSQLGIWIDPIDATAEYISGKSTFTNPGSPGISSTGLECVTVLIGVYEMSTGVPLMGVISQPFSEKLGDSVYKSKIVWGVALPRLSANNIRSDSFPDCTERAGIFSSSENPDILENISKLGYRIIFSAGAGYKALKVITGEVNLYLLSKGSTFRWDTCAPQAILRSMGGDVFNFVESVRQRKPIPLSYFVSRTYDEDQKCNKGGLIAVRDSHTLGALLKQLTA